MTPPIDDRPCASPAPCSPPSMLHRLSAWLEGHFWLPVLVVFLGGLLARVLLALPTMLNPDEAMHIILSTKPTVWQMYLDDLAGPDPSLLHLILFPLVKLHAHDFILRLPSMLAGSFAALFGYLWLKELFDRTTGLIGMILLAFAPAAVYFSAEIRAYALLVFFSVAALYCFEAGIRRNAPWLLLLFGLSQCLALVSQYSAIYLIFAAGCYSFYVVLRRRARGRLVGAWIAAETMTVALLVFQYITHLSHLHGSQIETQMKGSFLSRAYFSPVKENILAFVGTRTVAAFGFLFTSRYIGYAALALFVAGVVVLLVRGIAGTATRFPSSEDGGCTSPSRRETAFLFVVPWLAAALGGLLSLYPFAGMRHVSLLIVFAVPPIAFLLRQFAGPRPVVVLLAAIVLVPVWVTTRINYAAGWPIDPRESTRLQVGEAVDHVHRLLPNGGIVFSDLESHHVFRHYLFRGNPGAGRSAPPAYYEYEWNGFRLVTLKYWKVKAESLGDELHRMAESYGLEPGTPVAVASCGWGLSLARNLERQGISYPGTREFSKNVAVLEVPVGSEILSEETARQAEQTRQALYGLAYVLARAIRQPARMVLWPSSYADSMAIELASALGDEVRSYRMLYGLPAPFEDRLPVLAFWVFGTKERHSPLMAPMNEGGNYLYADLRFTLLANDPDTITAVYLVE